MPETYSRAPCAENVDRLRLEIHRRTRNWWDFLASAVAAMIRLDDDADASGGDAAIPSTGTPNLLLPAIDDYYQAGPDVGGASADAAAVVVDVVVALRWS